MSAISVILGGGLGAYLRYLVQLWLPWKGGDSFPWATWFVNVSGSFLIALLMTAFVERFKMSPEWRLFLVVGILGGFTTFSTLAWESHELFTAGHLIPGITYLLATLLGGALALAAGSILGHRIG